MAMKSLSHRIQAILNPMTLMAWAQHCTCVWSPQSVPEDAQPKAVTITPALTAYMMTYFLLQLTILFHDGSDLHAIMATNLSKQSEKLGVTNRFCHRINPFQVAKEIDFYRVIVEVLSGMHLCPFDDRAERSGISTKMAMNTNMHTEPHGRHHSQ